MMNVLRLLPVILSFLLLGAHFYRAGLAPLTLGCVAVLFVLFARRPWVPRLFQVLLALGALEWLRAMYVYIEMRMAWGESWTRLALILVSVALFTALSGLVFRARKLAARYRSA